MFTSCLPHVYLNMFTSCLPHVYLCLPGATTSCLPHVYLMFTVCLPHVYLCLPLFTSHFTLGAAKGDLYPEGKT